MSFEGDPYEGSPTYDMFEAWKRVFLKAHIYRDDAELHKRYDHERRAAFVSSWQKSEHESWFMWKQYCQKGGGFALQTTERKLLHALIKMREGRETLFLQDVHYVDHWSDDPLRHEVPVQVFLKPTWFSDEREIRFAWFRGEYAWAGTDEQIEAALSKLDKGEKISFNLPDVVEHMVLNPFSNKPQRESIVGIVRSKYPMLEERLCDSAIRKKPVAGII